MRKRNLILHALLTLCLTLWAAACNETAKTESPENGTLYLKFNGNPRDLSKVSSEMPDTNEFILTITDSDGKNIYDGIYANIPESFSVAPGSYRIFARSEEFSKPEFDRQQYGDEQCIVVPSKGSVQANLSCSQINSGIRLSISPDFLTEYPDGTLWVKSADGKLLYGYREKRIAYFKPGDISVALYNNGTEKILLTRKIAAREILSLKISVSSKRPDAAKGISITVDTSRQWTNESFTIGDEDKKGSSHIDAMTVNQAKVSIGREDVWVKGFVVGGNLTSSGISYDGPFKSNSNLAIAGRMIPGSRESCIAVQLTAGKIRDALNLVTNPDLLGREICVNGDLVESYFGLVGIKNVSDFVIR